MNKKLMLCVTFLISTNAVYSMNPVYSAQASGNYDPNVYIQGDGGNQNNNQNNNSLNQQNQNNGQNYSQPQNNQGAYQQYEQTGGYQNNPNNNQSPNGNNNLSGNNGNNFSQNNSNQNNFGNNNNQSNNNQPNTASNGYNNQPTNNQNNNNQNNSNLNNAQNNNQQNIFTENYARKGMHFNATVYKKDRNNRLYKTTLNSSDLQKAIVIFFGDWCPHCARFLGNFSKNMPSLMQAGVRIIFIAVPSINRLQNWQEPTDADFNEHLQKLNGFGIRLGNSSELVLLGDKASLNNNAVDSLPTMMAISNGKECFRGGADNSIEKVEFASQDALGQFLQVFNSFGSPQNYNNNIRQITTNNNYRRSKNSDSKHNYYGKVNVERTNMFTEMLNSGCDYSCVLKRYTPPKVTYHQSPSYQQCPPCPACPVCPQCSAPVPVQSQPKTVSNENHLSTYEVNPETCTTCGCLLRRAFSKKCNKVPTKKRCKTKRCCKNVNR